MKMWKTAVTTNFVRQKEISSKGTHGTEEYIHSAINTIFILIEILNISCTIFS